MAAAAPEQCCPQYVYDEYEIRELPCQSLMGFLDESDQSTEQLQEFIDDHPDININARCPKHFYYRPLEFLLLPNTIKRKERIEILLKNRADPSLRTYGGDGTLLHKLCIKDPDPKIVYLLVEYGEDINDIAHSSYAQYSTPLHTASCFQTRNIEFILALLNCGANINAVDSRGCTPFYYFLERGTLLPIIDLMIERGATGIIPPHCPREMVIYLITHGFDYTNIQPELLIRYKDIIREFNRERIKSIVDNTPLPIVLASSIIRWLDPNSEFLMY